VTTDTSIERGKAAATAAGTVAAAEDAHATAERAADDFLVAVRTAIKRLPDPHDLDGPAAALTEALARIGADAKPAITAASAAVGVYWRHTRAISLQVRRDDAAAHLPAVAAALDAALVTFAGQGDLDAALAAVAQHNAEQAEVLADLEQAVAAADVEAVLRLRPRIEVELPAAMDAARLTVAELELERAECQRDRPRRRAEAAARAQETAQGEVEQAQAALEEATAAAQAAVQQRFLAEQVAAQVEQQTRELAAEVDQLRQANAQSLNERLRRLAGLPPEAPTTEPTTGATR